MAVKQRIRWLAMHGTARGVSRLLARRDDVDRDVEIANKSAHHMQLLEILLAKECPIGTGLEKKLGDDGRHPESLSQIVQLMNAHLVVRTPPQRQRHSRKKSAP